MKKFIKVFLMALVAALLISCGTKPSPETKTETPVETPVETPEEPKVPETPQETPGAETETEPTGKVADTDLWLITDVGTIDDKSFNQGSYEGLKMYADEVDSKANYIQPGEESDAAYLTAIDQAVEGGAKVVVTPGFLFANVILQAQDKYPEVKFILIDAVPNNGAQDPAKYVEKVADNTLSILYKESQAGFLAGYAIVKEGYTKLGYMGGYAVPAVVGFGYGWAAGADYAAKELGVDVTIKYTYLNSFKPDPQFVTMAGSWYNEGIEVIHAAAGGAGNSVMAAAEAANKLMVGVDVDQKDESTSVVTSAMKNLRLSVYEATKSIYEGGFKGGQILNLGVESQGVQISDDFSRFNNFTKADYDAIYAKLLADEGGMTTNIPDLSTTDDVTKLQFEKVKIELVD